MNGRDIHRAQAGPDAGEGRSTVIPWRPHSQVVGTGCRRIPGVPAAERDRQGAENGIAKAVRRRFQLKRGHIEDLAQAKADIGQTNISNGD